MIASETSIPNLDAAYDRTVFLARLRESVTMMEGDAEVRRRRLRACSDLAAALDACAGQTLQDRWLVFEQTVWPPWKAGRNRPSSNDWMTGARIAVMNRHVVPSWPWLQDVHLRQWAKTLDAANPLRREMHRLDAILKDIRWATALSKELAISTAVRLLITRSYDRLEQIAETDLKHLPRDRSKGTDVLDAGLCALGVFQRSLLRGASRRSRRARQSVEELVAHSDIPERFHAITTLYLQTYAARVSDVYTTLRHKLIALAHFWRFMNERYPEVQNASMIRPAQARAFIPYAIERANRVRRGPAGEEHVRTTAHAWLIDVRVFLHDLCTWATDPESPFVGHAPQAVPLTRHDLMGTVFQQARKRTKARITATIFELERAMPSVRAFAFRQWCDSEQQVKAQPEERRAEWAEARAFWDWALLELLVQSGVRVEEASELTTLDVLKRQVSDGRVYYMLHVKPSKFDRARVIPIGDGLGRVIAEIIRHVRRFYRSDSVPVCDHWDHHERRPLPRAPYLLQGARYPSAMGLQTIRGRIKAVAKASGMLRSDGAPLVLLPHDCRRVFASEHLNNNTPIHVIAALLGHATPDTVMVYAKLYPHNLVEEYRKAVRGLYIDFHGPESLRNPTPEEWAKFSASCSMRDMGTHLCALPTGEYCPKGLVCLGCVHAQPKKSAAPVFRKMLASHERELAAARTRGEPAGQIAARELEVSRIRHALQRAEELHADVAAAIESLA